MMFEGSDKLPPRCMLKYHSISYCTAPCAKIFTASQQPRHHASVDEQAIKMPIDTQGHATHGVPMLRESSWGSQRPMVVNIVIGIIIVAFSLLEG